MIDGAIDRHSRMITYLQCNSNNLAATDLHLCIGAISIHNHPPRVRADFGVKNVDVACFMLDCPERGIDRESFTSGTFEHNPCIEGLWGEVISYVVLSFHNALLSLKIRDLLIY